MKCPNCTFDIQGDSTSCPYCNVSIDPSAAKAPVIDRPAHIGSSRPIAMPTPLAQDPVQPAAGDAVEYPPKQDVEEPLPEEPPRSAGGHGDAVKKVLPLAAFAAVAFSLFRFGVFDNILIPMGLKSPPKPAVPSVVQASVEKAAVKASVERTALTVETEKAVDVEPPARVLAPKPAPVRRPEEWWFRGRVYELTTLRPVRGITLLFLGGDEEISVRTDSKGEYKIRVPIPKEVVGYDVLLDSTRYADEYLIDSNARIRKLGARARNQLRATTRDIPPWRGNTAQWSRRDLAVIPL